jgi:hypothetical protein
VPLKKGGWFQVVFVNQIIFGVGNLFTDIYKKYPFSLKTLARKKKAS